MALPMRSTDFRSVVEPILNETFDGIYNVRKDEWNGNTRTLLDVDLVEVSVVIQAAYPQTEAALRSSQTPRLLRARELQIRSLL